MSKPFYKTHAEVMKARARKARRQKVLDFFTLRAVRLRIMKLEEELKRFQTRAAYWQDEALRFEHMAYPEARDLQRELDAIERTSSNVRVEEINNGELWDRPPQKVKG